MSTVRTDGRGGVNDSGVLDICALPDDCIAAIISFTTALDACRLSLVSTVFKTAADSDTVWVKFLPSDCQNLISEYPAVSSKKDLYFRLCDNPVLIEDGRKSFSLDKRSGKKCYMLAARDLTIIWGDTPSYWKWITLPDSRFSEVAELLSVCWFEVRGRINTHMLSPMTHYKAYLVFKATMATFGFDYQPVEVTVGLTGTEGRKQTVYVDIERERGQRYWIPTRRGGMFRNLMMRQPASRPLRESNGQQYPKDRKDGWSEVELGEFFNEGLEDGELEVSILQLAGHWKGGLVIQGIEIRPVSSI
ncbi:hypothetical protein SLA2020_108240 [Shorea laevis]